MGGTPLGWGYAVWWVASSQGNDEGANTTMGRGGGGFCRYWAGRGGSEVLCKGTQRQAVDLMARLGLELGRGGPDDRVGHGWWWPLRPASCGMLCAEAVLMCSALLCHAVMCCCMLCSVMLSAALMLQQQQQPRPCTLHVVGLEVAAAVAATANWRQGDRAGLEVAVAPGAFLQAASWDLRACLVHWS
jgi:hypothetical protein